MVKIDFKDLPDTTTPVDADNLNQLQENVEDAIDNVSIDLDSQVSTTSTNGVENQAITNYVNNLIPDVYSTTETQTNMIWIDGKPIYRIVYTGRTTSGGAYTTVTTTFSGNIIYFGGIVINVDNNTIYSIVGEHGSNGDFIFPYFQNGNTIQLCNNNTNKTFDYYLVVEYTKSS